ncbi:MAG: DNA repair protein RecO C-terminal domain-containing protein, partial [Bacteroidota bacterium]
SSITLFLTEVLSKLLQAEPANPPLYQFISESVQVFNYLEQCIENFHLQFLMKIASFLGFGLDEFEILFTSLDQLVPHHEGAHVWELLINEPYGVEILLNRKIRNHILDSLIGYYRHHANLAIPKSLEVLRSVLS